MDRNRPAAGYTLVELTVTIAIMLVLIVILIPALRGSVSARDRIRCAAQLRDIAVATQIYADDQQGAYPPLIFWFTPGASDHIVVLVQPRRAAVSGLDTYAPATLLCPADRQPGTMPVLTDDDTRVDRPISYAFNLELLVRGMKQHMLRSPSATAVFFDGSLSGPGDGGTNIQGSYRDGLEFASRAWAPRHDGLANVLFADWHVDERERPTAPMILPAP